MLQDDIFRLLLILLLMTNERDRNCGCNDPCNPFGSMNEIIIIALLLFSGSGNNANPTNADGNIPCCPGSTVPPAPPAPGTPPSSF